VKKILTFIFVFTLSACGSKGDLYIPDQESKNTFNSTKKNMANEQGSQKGIDLEQSLL